MERPEAERRAAARARAELFGWPQAVDGFLRAHGARTVRTPRGRPAEPAVLRPEVPVFEVAVAGRSCPGAAAPPAGCPQCLGHGPAPGDAQWSRSA